MEKNNRETQEKSAGVSEEEVKLMIAEAMRNFASHLLSK